MYIRNEVISIGGEDDKYVLAIKFDKRTSHIEQKINTVKTGRNIYVFKHWVSCFR